MGLNKIKGNMYSDMGLTHTWNPLSGTCNHGCTYCSTNKLRRYEVIDTKYSGECRIVDKDLCNLGKGNTIFVCAQTDLFASDVPNQLILRILEHMDKFDNKYLLQTKNPDRVIDFIDYPILIGKCTICTTIESDIFYPDIMQNSPSPAQRSFAMEVLSQVIDTYVIIEPIMDFNIENMVCMISRCNPKQVNIGADSGNNHLPEPSKEKLLALIDELKKFTIIANKRNLNRLFK